MTIVKLDENFIINTDDISSINKFTLKDFMGGELVGNGLRSLSTFTNIYDIATNKNIKIIEYDAELFADEKDPALIEYKKEQIRRETIKNHLLKYKSKIVLSTNSRDCYVSTLTPAQIYELIVTKEKQTTRHIIRQANFEFD